MKTRGFEIVGDGGIIPTRGTKHSAGYDLHTTIDITIPPRATALIPTNVSVYMQEDEWFEIKARSGLSLKKYTSIGAGVIDADYYPKPIGVIIHSQNDEPIEFKAGDRIAQGIFHKYLLADDDAAEKERTDGFGHTGVKGPIKADIKPMLDRG